MPVRPAHLALVALVALAVLASPAIASAVSWPIYANSGQRAGSVHRGDATKDPSDWDEPVAEVFQNTTMARYCGKLTYVWTELGRAKRLWNLVSGDDQATGDMVKKVSANRYDVIRYRTTSRDWRTIANAVRGKNGPWRLMKRTTGGYVKKGMAPRACPGYDAAAGGYLLLLFGRPPS
jgi:hypothetical protein